MKYYDKTKTILPMQENVSNQNVIANNQLPVQNYQYEKSDNVKIDNLRKDASIHFNNSEKSKNYINMLEKIIQDKNIDIRLDSNLTDSQGNIANGKYENGVITINPNSNRAGEFIAIYELTHAIGTDSMRNIIENYRKSNMEFDNAVKSLLENYNITELTDEAMADVSAQLFGNQEYINNLAQTNPSLFKRIYNEIKYLWHQFTGYKNQNQFIEDLQYKWEQAYRNNNKLNETTNYSIQENKNGKYIKVDTDQDIFKGIEEKDYNKIAKMYMQDYLKGNTKLSESDNATIGSKGINKYTNPKQQTKYMTEKMQLTPELKNVLKIAEKVQDSPPTKDTSKYPNWEYYKFNFELGGKPFEGLINIGIDKNGNKHFYEINKIHTTSNSYVSTNKSSSTDSINNIILPTQENVNSTNSNYMQESENNSGSFSMDNKRFDVTGNENLDKSGTLFFRTRDDGIYYVQATDHAGDLIYEGTFIDKKGLAKTLGEDIAEYIVNNSESTNNEIYINNNGNPEKDYRMYHRPSEEYGNASNFESNMPDVFENPQWYMNMKQDYNIESLNALRKVRTNPEAEIIIYRATPGDSINNGDWVTPSRKYAEFHNESQLNGKGNILELKVKAKDLLWGGDDINEFGYFPDNGRYSKNNQKWQEYLDNNIEAKGNKTNLEEIKLPTKLENNQQTRYNTNGSESGINGREAETFKQNDQRRNEGLFPQHGRGQENGRGYQGNFTKQQEIEYIRNKQNHITDTELTEYQKNIKRRYENIGIPVNFYSLDSKNGGRYDNGVLYINTKGLTEEQQAKVAMHEYAHHKLRSDINFQNEISSIADSIIEAETTGQSEAIRNYIMDRTENITLDELKNVQKYALEEILADYIIDIDNDVDFSKNNQYGINENILNEYRDIVKKYLPKKQQILPTKETSNEASINLPTKGENIDWNEVEKPEGKFRKHYQSIVEIYIRY